MDKALCSTLIVRKNGTLKKLISLVIKITEKNKFTI